MSECFDCGVPGCIRVARWITGPWDERTTLCQTHMEELIPDKVAAQYVTRLGSGDTCGHLDSDGHPIGPGCTYCAGTE